MARLNLDTIKKIEKDRVSVHTKVTTTYSVFEKDGEKYVQIVHMVKEIGLFQEKISQSIQFDRSSAKFLAELLEREFNL